MHFIMGKGSLKEKNERRKQLLGLLKSDSSCTLCSLSQSLGVSERTVSRDIFELKEEGYTIETCRGRGGGLRLNGLWGVERILLRDVDIISILVSLVITEKLSPAMLATDAKQIRQKIANFFPASQRKNISRIRQRIMIGENASEQVLSSYKSPKTEVMNTLTNAFFSFRKLDIFYVNEKRERTSRVVEPQVLILNFPVWYVACWDEYRNDFRLFRTDRIHSSKMLTDTCQTRNTEHILTDHQAYFSAL